MTNIGPVRIRKANSANRFIIIITLKRMMIESNHREPGEVARGKSESGAKSIHRGYRCELNALTPVSH